MPDNLFDLCPVNLEFPFSSVLNLYLIDSLFSWCNDQITRFLNEEAFLKFKLINYLQLWNKNVDGATMFFS